MKKTALLFALIFSILVLPSSIHSMKEISETNTDKDSTKKDENLWIYVHNKKYAKVSDKFYLHTWLPMVRKIKSKGIADKTYRTSKFAKEFTKKQRCHY